MRHAGWQVQHVTGLQHPIMAGREAAQHFEFNIFATSQRRIGRGIDLPMPLALGLQQKHIVLIDMRTHRPSGGGKTDHDVVNAPTWQKIEMRQQTAHIAIPLVHILHQQRPVVVRQAGEVVFRKRPVAHAPTVVACVVLDQTRQHAVFAGQTRQIFRLDR